MKILILQHRDRWDLTPKLNKVKDFYKSRIDLQFEYRQVNIDDLRYRKDGGVHLLYATSKWKDEGADIVVLVLNDEDYKDKSTWGRQESLRTGKPFITMRAKEGRTYRDGRDQFFSTLRHELCHAFYGMAGQRATDQTHYYDYKIDNLLLVLQDIDWSKIQDIDWSKIQDIDWDKVLGEQDIQIKTEPLLDKVNTMLLCPLQNTALFTTHWVQKRPHITQEFGKNPLLYEQFGMKGHNGLDFRAKTGTKVFAPMDGIVRVRTSEGGYGKHVQIRNADKASECVMAHLSEFKVIDGQRVNAGDVIGLSGNTGFSTAPHLHFGYRLLKPKDGDVWSWAVLEHKNGYFGYIDPSSFLITFKGTLIKNTL